MEVGGLKGGVGWAVKSFALQWGGGVIVRWDHRIQGVVNGGS